MADLNQYLKLKERFKFLLKTKIKEDIRDISQIYVNKATVENMQIESIIDSDPEAPILAKGVSDAIKAYRIYLNDNFGKGTIKNLIAEVLTEIINELG
jgi:hypothetical protein